MKLNLTLLEITLAFLVSLSVYLWVKHGKRLVRWWKEMHIRHRRPRQLRPREPADCPQCATGVHWLPKHPRQGVIPWSQVKSPRGRKKQVDTKGHACLNPLCAYFGIADPTIHALVSNGRRGINRDIPLLQVPGVRLVQNQPTEYPHVSSQNTHPSRGDGDACTQRRAGHLSRIPVSSTITLPLSAAGWNVADTIAPGCMNGCSFKLLRWATCSWTNW